jgi:D-alanyl-D-alanine carboxypeptidase/D-alanyl-D-alanine-endopeptidase (penicillin-binding protein 4)
MAEMLADQLGGAQVVRLTAVELTGVAPNEIQLVNGSGLGKANQISPRAVVAMLIALQNLSQNYGFTIADLMPVAGCGCGTVAFRDLPQGAVVKTGTLNDVSSLAGIIQTKDKGVVWFAILNQGAGDLAIYHKAQLELLQNLHNRWHFQSFYHERSWQRF